MPPPAVVDDEPFAFTPVRARARHDGWTPDRQRRFVVALALTGIVSRAAAAVAMSTASAYALRRRKDAGSFVSAWDAALQEGRDRAFHLAMDRAINGIPRPRYHHGRFVGTAYHYDHHAIVAALMPSVPPGAKADTK